MDTAKNYLLIGGNSGIGLATRERLMRAGHRLTIAARSPDSMDEAQKWDVSDPDFFLKLPDVLDGVVYFPGTVTLKPFHRLSRADFQNDLEVNLLGAVRVLQLALPALKHSQAASVVLFSSVAASTGMPMHASIAAAKAALEGLAVSLAAEWAPLIRVNVIAPSLTDTPLVQRFLSDPARATAAAERHPLKRVGQAGDIAAMVEFLLGPESGFMTGQILRPDGGLSSLRLL